jgi:hypothetical protein
MTFRKYRPESAAGKQKAAPLAGSGSLSGGAGAYFLAFLQASPHLPVHLQSFSQVQVGAHLQLSPQQHLWAANAADAVPRTRAMERTKDAKRRVMIILLMNENKRTWINGVARAQAHGCPQT